jgi:6-phosphogluconolactonase
MPARFRTVVAALAAACLFVPSLRAAEKKPAPAKAYHVYFGTYTGPKSKGIYVSKLDAATGRLGEARVAAETKSPSFLAVHPNNRVLFAVGEVNDFEGKPAGGVSAFAIDAASGNLTLLNSQTSGGAGPCHLSVDKSGKCVLVANYGGGSVQSIKVLPDGRLGDVGTFIQHKGSSVNASRQSAPHAHSINLSPDNRFAFAADLGLDKVLIYKLDAASAALTASEPAFAPVAPGSGPRHFAFHPGGKSAYVINEMTCTMTAFSYDAARGELKEVQTLSTLPPGETVKAGFSTAEVVAHPSGRFLFGSNRGHDTIVVFSVDAATGRLTHVENQPTLGKTPRNFAVDPTGAWLLAENQGSGTVAVFRIDAQTGKLTHTGQTLEVPTPVCARFVPAP